MKIVCDNANEETRACIDCIALRNKNSKDFWLMFCFLSIANAIGEVSKVHITAKAYDETHTTVGVQHNNICKVT